MCQAQWGPNIPGLRPSLEPRAHLLICPALPVLGQWLSYAHPLPRDFEPWCPCPASSPLSLFLPDVPLRNVFQQRLTCACCHRDLCTGGSLSLLLNLGQERLASSPSPPPPPRVPPTPPCMAETSTQGCTAG